MPISPSALPSRSARYATMVAAALMLALAAAPPIPAAAQVAAQQPMLTANGDGEVMVVPDIAIVTLGVTSRAPTAGQALAQNSADLQAAVDAVKAAGVAEKDIATSGISVSPVYQTRQQPSDQPPPIIGYTVSNNVTVTIRDVAKSGAILDQVVKAGANRVSGVSFDISDRKAAEEAAIKAAIAEARQRGALMAEAAGVRLVRVLTVTANANGGGPVPVFRAAPAAADSFAPPVLPGEQKVTANAQVTWEITGQ